MASTADTYWSAWPTLQAWLCVGVDDDPYRMAYSTSKFIEFTVVKRVGGQEVQANTEGGIQARTQRFLGDGSKGDSGVLCSKPVGFRLRRKLEEDT